MAERLFNDAKVDVFLLEYDNARSGGFEPLRFVPNHKAVVLGLISSKTAALESAAELAKRIDASSRYIPLDRLGLSPQCGFGTTVGGVPMTEDEEKRKLELVVQVAADVWRS